MTEREWVLLFITFAFVLVCPASGLADECNALLLPEVYAFAEYAYSSDFLRQKALGKQAFLEYKKHAIFQGHTVLPAVVELHTNDIFMPSHNPYLIAAANKGHESELRLGKSRRPVTVYEERVLMLKVGDTVVFEDGFRVTLGEYLGAGNTGHVFGIAGDSSLAIKIPFLATDLVWGKEGDKPLRPQDPILGGRNYIRWLPKIADRFNNVDRVQIRKTSRKYAYLIVERVNEEMSATEFVATYKIDSDFGIATDEERKLRQELSRMSTLVWEDSKKRGDPRHYLRQIVLVYPNTRLKKPRHWKLVDWE